MDELCALLAVLHDLSPTFVVGHHWLNCGKRPSRETYDDKDVHRRQAFQGEAGGLSCSRWCCRIDNMKA